MKVERACKHCQRVFLIHLHRIKERSSRGTFCSRDCAFAYRAAAAIGVKGQRARAQNRNRAFVDAANARTVCAHCGAQPIEWHNPEHVLLGRQLMRISAMASTTRTTEAIQAEMDRCTPLCRRCHMVEDGRMKRFVEAGGGRFPKKAVAP